MDKRNRYDMNNENVDYMELIRNFLLEDRGKHFTFNKLMREVLLQYMIMNKLRTNIPEEELKRFENLRDLHLARQAAKKIVK